MDGDLNNISAARAQIAFEPTPVYYERSLDIPITEDDAHIRSTYRPFYLNVTIFNSDWVAQLEPSNVLKPVEEEVILRGEDRPKTFALYGSMRARYALGANWSSTRSMIYVVHLYSTTAHLLVAT